MDVSSFKDEQQISGELKCVDCGALLKFSPNDHELVCNYCGAHNPITSSNEKIDAEEINYLNFLQQKIKTAETKTLNTVQCNNCGAVTTFNPTLTSDNCAFCASPLVIKNGSTSTVIQPKYVLPFSIDDKTAHKIFNDWIKSRWFAPNDLKKYATINEKLKGIYMPYWTFDSQATTTYIGARGEYYYEGEGKERKQKTRWFAAQGTVNNTFDDVCVLASRSLPNDTTRELEPWDLQNLKAYNEAYISGFQTECYQVDVQNGFEEAKSVMQENIEQTVKMHIGGDVQQIQKMHITHNDVTFKHILLPIWISVYRYNNKPYRFIINGSTGEIQGQRPYSIFKILFAILTAVAIIWMVFISN